MYTINHNEAFGSLEIRFDRKPTPAVLAAVKALRFRWHGLGCYWYGKADEQTVRETLDRLTARAEKIAGANRKHADREPVAPSPKRAPAPMVRIVSDPVPAADPEPAAPIFPKREDIKTLSFSYRIGNAVGQAQFTPELLENASASTLKVIYPMIDGIADEGERKNAWFTLAALAWYTAAENPEKMPAYRNAAKIYREKTGEEFPAPKTESDGKPAASKTVTAACKRIAKNAPTGWNALVSDAGRSIISTTCCVVCLTSCAPDLALAESENAEKIAGFIRSAEEHEHERALPLPTVRELKAWIKCQPAPRKADSLYYEIDGLFVDAHYLLDMLEALPGCAAYVPRVPNLYSPILFVSGDDRGILMQLRPRSENAA